MKQRSTLFRICCGLIGVICLLPTLLCGCETSYQTLSSYAMGSKFDLTLPQGQSGTDYLALLARTERTLSDAFSSSLCAVLNAGEAFPLPLEPDIEAMLVLGEELRQKTDGAFSLLAGEETALWVFDGGDGAVPAEELLEKAVAATENATLVRTEEGLTLSSGKMDLGAAGKGLAAERLAALLRKNGECGLISCGSTTVAVGKKNGRPWRIGVRDPFGENGALLGVLSLSNMTLSTSGNYEKCFFVDGVRYHHILDARTGMPAGTGLVSVTVLASDATLADMLSTAVFLLGAESGMALCEQYGAQALLVNEQGDLLMTEGCRSLFTPYK